MQRVYVHPFLFHAPFSILYYVKAFVHLLLLHALHNCSTTGNGLFLSCLREMWEKFFFLPLSHLSKGLVQECRSWCMEERVCTEPQEHHISMCRQEVNSPEALLWQNHKGYWSERKKCLISRFQANWKRAQLGSVVMTDFRWDWKISILNMKEKFCPIFAHLAKS